MWTDIAGGMYDGLVDSFGESFAINLGQNTASLTGIYDGRILVDNVGGTEYQVADYRIGVRGSDLPAWVAKDAQITIRTHTLHLTDIRPDGQGWTFLICRPA